LVRRRRRWILGYLALYWIAFEAIAASLGNAGLAVVPLIGLVVVLIVWAVAGPTLIRVIAAYLVGVGLLCAVVWLLDLGDVLGAIVFVSAAVVISLIVLPQYRRRGSASNAQKTAASVSQTETRAAR
jgi:hypothetical protein